MARKATTRRAFLHTAAAALAAPTVLPSRAFGANDRVTLGAVGVGGRGTGVMRGFLRRAQVLAVCDVKRTRREAAKSLVERAYSQEMAKGTYKGCAATTDYRELVAREDIDAVSIATPDHWHALVGIAAAQAGKDVYCEKPLTLNVAEGRAYARAITRYGRVFQHGTQQRSSGNFRHACELVRNHRIGKLHTIRVGSPRSGTCPPQPPMPVPQGFDYDRWLGPAPWAPYTAKRCVTPWWYFIADYTMGFISGWGVHHVDIAQWGNGTDHTGPVTLEGSGDFPDDGLCDTATAWRVVCTYANGVRMVYADNRKEKQGVRFEGDEGWVYVRRGHIDAQPKSLLKETVGPNETRLHRSRGGHAQDFINGVRSRGATACPIETAHRSNSICQLADIAIRLRRKLRWNPQTEQFVDDEEANRMLAKAMRAPWHL
ncbi:MAG: Gfo/Idh/MocA family protein [Candidatus Brocadiia bacterium]